MIFLGDFIYPFKKKYKFYDFNKEFIDEPKVVNLESLILNPENSNKITSGIALHSSKHILSIFDELNVKTVGLANNHITDFNFNIVDLKFDLEKIGVNSVGAGRNLNEAIKPSFIEDYNFKYIIFSFGWNVIGCRYASHNNSGVAPLDEKLILKEIINAKVEYPNHKIILLLHWNYEFEYYPQPADRKLAFSAIDVGADAIIGHHPHIVGVYEEYKSKPIFYSLGNFFLPEYDFGGGIEITTFNELAQKGLGVKFSDNLNEITLYWIYNENNKLEIEMTEFLCKSKRIRNFSHHYQDDLHSYSKWFKINRRKKKLLPIYNEHNGSLKNKLLFNLLEIRNYIVHKITLLGLRKRNN